MSDDSAGSYFHYAAMCQLSYNVTDGQMPTFLTANPQPLIASGPTNDNISVINSGQQGPYNLQEPSTDNSNLQNALTYNNLSIPTVSGVSAEVPVVASFGIEPNRKLNIQDASSKLCYTINGGSDTIPANFDNQPIAMFFNSSGAIDMKLKPCGKNESNESNKQLNAISIPNLSETISTSHNLEDLLGNKTTDISTKSMLLSSGNIANIIIPTNNNPTHYIQLAPVSTTPFVNNNSKQPKRLKNKKPSCSSKVSLKIKYTPAGQVNLYRSKASKYSKLFEIRKAFYSSCHVCFNDPHMDMQGCPLMTPTNLIENLDNHVIGYGMPEQLLLGLSRLYKGEDSIFARDYIPAYTRFGPLKGKKLHANELNKLNLEEVNLRHIWPVNASEVDELHLDSFVDTQDVKDSNWMRFLKPEIPDKQNSSASSYNIQRVTLDEEIYFITTRDIPPGEELLFRAIEPPFRAFYNLQHLAKTNTTCQMHPCKKKKQAATLDFGNLIYFVRHAYLSHSNKPGIFKVASIYNCNLCKEDYFDMGNYLNHCKEKHAEVNHQMSSYNCNLCNKVFSSKIVYKKHIKEEHVSRDNKFACMKCGSTFLEKHHLLCHLKTAHQPEPVPCKTCGKIFKNKPVMENHVKKVHEQKYWKECTLCGKGFKDLYQLRQHMLTHTGAKPFCCIIKGCPARFTTKQWLQKHYIGGHGFTIDNMPNIQRKESFNTNETMPLLSVKPRPKKKATYVPPAKPGTSLRIPDDFSLTTALRTLGKAPVKNKIAKIKLRSSLQNSRIRQSNVSSRLHIGES